MSQRLFAIGHHFPWYTPQEECSLQQYLVLNADITQRNAILATRCHMKRNDSTPRMQSTSETNLEIALVEDITSMSAASFESRAQVYNENFRKVYQDRLQEFTAFGRNITDERSIRGGHQRNEKIHGFYRESP